jgi:hypothetical protein
VARFPDDRLPGAEYASGIKSVSTGVVSEGFMPRMKSPEEEREKILSHP